MPVEVAGIPSPDVIETHFKDNIIVQEDNHNGGVLVRFFDDNGCHTANLTDDQSRRLAAAILKRVQSVQSEAVPAVEDLKKTIKVQATAIEIMAGRLVQAESPTNIKNALIDSALKIAQEHVAKQQLMAHATMQQTQEPC